MSEEEKKAIETLKEVASDDFDTLGDDISPKMAQNILNILDKQQKEIEEKDKYIKAIADIRIQDCKENYSDVIDKYFISKDKIKEKIKDYDKWIKEGGDYTESLQAQKYALQELLEEK